MTALQHTPKPSRLSSLLAYLKKGSLMIRKLCVLHYSLFFAPCAFGSDAHTRYALIKNDYKNKLYSIQYGFMDNTAYTLFFDDCMNKAEETCKIIAHLKKEGVKETSTLLVKDYFASLVAMNIYTFLQLNQDNALHAREYEKLFELIQKIGAVEKLGDLDAQTEIQVTLDFLRYAQGTFHASLSPYKKKMLSLIGL